MKFAIFADIHANFHAFRACYDAAKREKAEGFVFLGDFFTDMAYPQRTMDLIYEIMEAYPCHIVRGNREAYMLSQRAGKQNYRPGSNTGSLFYTYTHLREKDLDFVAAFPSARKIDIADTQIAIAHSTFESDRYYFDDTGRSIDVVFEQMPAQYLLTAHSHVQYAAQRAEKVIVNPGSVGYAVGQKKSLRGRAQFALIDAQDGRMQWQLCETPYDVRAAIADQFESGLVDCARCWALSVLNTLVTGKNMTIAVLKRVEAFCAAGESMDDEETWLRACRDEGAALRKEELLEMCKNL